MKILITGGKGYLGGRLAQHLYQLPGYEIITGTRAGSVGEDQANPATTVRIDWDSEDSLRDICAGVNTIIHLAGMNAAASAADPVKAFEFNGAATGKLVQQAARRGVKRFIYFSTAHVYRSPLTGTITESTPPVSVHPYATSHKAGEDMVEAAHRRGEIEGVVVRLSNAVGAPATKAADCWSLLVNDLSRQVVTRGAMNLTSSGLQRRDFITLTDVCRATRHLMTIPLPEEGSNIFNVGGDWSPTVLEMAELIRQCSQELLGFEPVLTRKEPAPGEMTEQLEYRIDKLKQTGFTLSSDWGKEIRQLLLFCQSSFSGDNSKAL